MYDKKTYQKNWREKNKEKIKQYWQEHRQEIIERRRLYRRTHRKQLRNAAKKRYKNNPAYKEKSAIYEKERLKKWQGLVPQHTKCGICGKDIYLNCGDRKKSICFDHRNEKTEAIKHTPSGWLANHARNSKNEAIWKSCNFGMLCVRCNILLPTKDRMYFLDWMKKAEKYILKGG